MFPHQSFDIPKKKEDGSKIKLSQPNGLTFWSCVHLHKVTQNCDWWHSLWHIVTIRGMQKDGTMHCILGRSTCQHQIYCVRMGIWLQIISIQKKFWTKLFTNSRVKVLGERLYWPNLRDFSCARKHWVTFFIFNTFVCNFFPANLQAYVWK